MSIISCKKLKKSYGLKVAIDSMDLELERGRIIGLVGPNGSGKTSLLRILGSFDQAYTGEVLINGVAPGPEARAITSYLPDKPSISEWMTPIECVKLYAEFFADFDAPKAMEMIRFFKLDPSQKLKYMSKGMKEKVQITLVMARQAQIYLLDEPISGVDPATRKIIMQSILSNYAENALLIISTHLLQDIEPIIDEVIFLDQGKIKLKDNVDNIRMRYQKSLNEVFEEVFS